MMHTARAGVDTVCHVDSDHERTDCWCKFGIQIAVMANPANKVAGDHFGKELAELFPAPVEGIGNLLIRHLFPVSLILHNASLVDCQIIYIKIALV
jgi:hypothetical protein